MTRGRPAAGLRAWAAVHSTRVALVVWAAAVLVGVIAGAVVIPSLGPVVLPELFPVNVLLTVAVGSGLALLADYRVDPRVVCLVPGRAHQAVARCAWLALGGLLAVAASRLVAPSEGLTVDAFAANALLFLALGMLMTWAGRPELAWLPGSMWVLAGLLFGYSGAGPTGWYPWAFPLAATAGPVRIGASLGLWVVAVILLVLAPPPARSAR